MSSIHSVPISGAPSGIGAVYADWFPRRGSDAGPVGRDRRRTRPAFQRRFPLTHQGQARLEDDIRREERCRERARIAHELHDTS
jgi:signal transduction histidine kinase